MIFSLTDLTKDILEIIKLKGEFYHEPEYLKYECERYGATPIYYIDRFDQDLFVIPLMSRLINEKGLKDLSSPYGYSGYLTSLVAAEKIQNAILRFETYINQLGYVSTFLRLNPYENNLLLDENSSKNHLIQSKVVIVNLKQSYNEVVDNYTSNRKREVEAFNDSDYEIEFIGAEGIEAFKQVYDATMKRLDAAEYYFFDYNYYEMLTNLNGRMEIALCKNNGVIASAALFMKSSDVIQYHLGGTSTDFMKDAPIKLIIDKAIQRYIGKHDVLNLGGGIGSKEDSLFKFKEGYSSITKRFSTLRIVNDLKKYNNLCQNFSKSEKKDFSQFFPLYRTPLSKQQY
jgi:hypothetical protein